MNFFKTLLILCLINCVAEGRYLKTLNDDSILEVTCLGKYTGVFHSFIYFAKNNTSTDYYVIRTAWLITYPDRIKDSLKEKDLYVYEKNPTSKCDWTLRSKIQQTAVERGYIYQKNNEDKQLVEIASEILIDLYPSLEIALLVLGSFIAFVLFILLSYKLGCMRSSYTGSAYRSY